MWNGFLVCVGSSFKLFWGERGCFVVALVAVDIYRFLFG